MSRVKKEKVSQEDLLIKIAKNYDIKVEDVKQAVIEAFKAAIKKEYRDILKKTTKNNIVLRNNDIQIDSKGNFKIELDCEFVSYDSKEDSYEHTPILVNAKNEKYKYGIPGNTFTQVVDTTLFNADSRKEFLNTLTKELGYYKTRNLEKYYKEKINTLITGNLIKEETYAKTVKVYDKDKGMEKEIYKQSIGCIISFGNGIEALLDKDNLFYKDHFKSGSPIQVILKDVKFNDESKKLELIVDRKSEDYIEALYKFYYPDIINNVKFYKIAFEDTVSGYYTPKEHNYISEKVMGKCKICVDVVNEYVDPVTALIGPNGERSSRISSDLGIQVEILKYSNNIKDFIINTIAPAKVITVLGTGDTKTKVAKVIVEDNQLSLAIGKSGINARLANVLTDWKIDIKSRTQANAEGQIF